MRCSSTLNTRPSRGEEVVCKLHVRITRTRPCRECCHPRAYPTRHVRHCAYDREPSAAPLSNCVCGYAGGYRHQECSIAEVASHVAQSLFHLSRFHTKCDDVRDPGELMIVLEHDDIGKLKMGARQSRCRDDSGHTRVISQSLSQRPTHCTAAEYANVHGIACSSPLMKKTRLVYEAASSRVHILVSVLTLHRAVALVS